MIKWKKESSANGTCHWVNLTDNIEVSLMRRNVGRQDLYQYSFKWDDGAFLNSHWTENLTAEDWTQAEAKAIMRTRAITANYIRELQDAMGAFWELRDE